MIKNNNINILNLINQKSQSISFPDDYSDKLVTFLDPYKYLIAREHPEYLTDIDIINFDGYLLLSLLKSFKIISTNTNRLSFDFTSLANVVFETSIKNNFSVCLIGTRSELINKAVSNIKMKYPNLNIIFYRDGYFKNENDEFNTIRELLALSPDVVISGMGIGKQERFLVNLKRNGWNGIGFTCGGFLHQISGKLDYFPKWINKYNLRWLYRIFKEPKNVCPRYKKILAFFMLFFYDIIKFYTKK